ERPLRTRPCGWVFSLLGKTDTRLDDGEPLVRRFHRCGGGVPTAIAEASMLRGMRLRANRFVRPQYHGYSLSATLRRGSPSDFMIAACSRNSSISGRLKSMFLVSASHSVLGTCVSVSG